MYYNAGGTVWCETDWKYWSYDRHENGQDLSKWKIENHSRHVNFNCCTFWCVCGYFGSEIFVFKSLTYPPPTDRAFYARGGWANAAPVKWSPKKAGENLDKSNIYVHTYTQIYIYAGDNLDISYICIEYVRECMMAHDLH